MLDSLLVASRLTETFKSSLKLEYQTDIVESRGESKMYTPVKHNTDHLEKPTDGAKCYQNIGKVNNVNYGYD